MCYKYVVKFVLGHPEFDLDFFTSWLEVWEQIHGVVVGREKGGRKRENLERVRRPDSR